MRHGKGMEGLGEVRGMKDRGSGEYWEATVKGNRRKKSDQFESSIRLGNKRLCPACVLPLSSFVCLRLSLPTMLMAAKHNYYHYSDL